MPEKYMEKDLNKFIGNIFKNMEIYGIIYLQEKNTKGVL